MRDVRIRGARVALGGQSDRLQLVNVALDGCDVAGLLSQRSHADRVLLTDTRLRGVTWADGLVEDVTFEVVRGAEVSFRFSTLRRVTFADCELPGLDLTETVFEQVRFERCDLTRTRFDHAKVGTLRLAGCDLSGCSGAKWLAGASVHPDDVLSLGPSLAAGLGIVVEDDPEDEP